MSLNIANVAASDQSQQNCEASVLCDLVLYMYNRLMKYMTCFPYCEINYTGEPRQATSNNSNPTKIH